MSSRRALCFAVALLWSGSIAVASDRLHHHDWIAGWAMIAASFVLLAILLVTLAVTTNWPVDSPNQQSLQKIIDQQTEILEELKKQNTLKDRRPFR